MRRGWITAIIAASVFAAPIEAADLVSGPGDPPETVSEADDTSGPRLAQFCPYGVASYCVTPWGSCPLGEFLCIGQPCYCPTFNGPVWGTAN